MHEGAFITSTGAITKLLAHSTSCPLLYKGVRTQGGSTRGGGGPQDGSAGLKSERELMQIQGGVGLQGGSTMRDRTW